MRSPKSPNDEVWLRLALEDTEALLRDHAHAERKAAATAMQAAWRGEAARVQLEVMHAAATAAHP